MKNTGNKREVSWLKYALSKGSPAYLQIYQQLREEITGGAYRFGERLPSKRLVAEEAGVSVVTVEHAYAILCDEGYAEARERSGYFVLYRSEDGFSVPALRAVRTVTSAAAPHMPFDFPFSVFARTMRRVLSAYGERILIKPPGHGCLELREALAAYLARSRGMSVRAEQIVIGSGAEYLYSLVLQLLGRERLYAIESPSYEKIKQIYTANGVRFEELRMGEDGILSCDLERAEAEILHVTPYRSFPTGVTASASKRREYLRFAERRGGYIIEDDFDSEFTVSSKMEDTIFSLSPAGRVVYVNTFSRTVAPAMRVGYMVLPAELLPEFEARLGFYTCTVPTFEQYVLAEFISSGDFERHINRVRRARRLSKKQEGDGGA